MVVFSEGRKLRNHFLKHKAKTDSAAVENSATQPCSKTTTRFLPTEIVLSRFCTNQTKCVGMGFLKGKTVYGVWQKDGTQKFLHFWSLWVCIFSNIQPKILSHASEDRGEKPAVRVN